MTTVYDNFQELLDNFSTKLEELSSQLEDARNQASYATDEADNACGQADEARSSARNAGENIESADSTREELGTLHEDLCTELEALRRLDGSTAAGTVVPAGGLEADIRKHKANVVMLKKKGKSPSDIATNLGISTILVDQILRRLAAA